MNDLSLEWIPSIYLLTYVGKQGREGGEWVDGGGRQVDECFPLLE